MRLWRSVGSLAGRSAVTVRNASGLLNQLGRQLTDVLLRDAHAAQLPCDAGMEAAIRIERWSIGYFVLRQWALTDAGQRLNQPPARSAGCVGVGFRHGSIGILGHCRKVVNQPLDCLDVPFHQAFAPYERTLSRPLGLVFGDVEINFEQTDRRVAGRIALGTAKGVPSPFRVVLIHADRGQALKGIGAQLGPGHFSDNPVQQRCLLPRPARIVIQVAKQLQGITVLASRASEVLTEHGLQKSDGPSGIAYEPGFLGRNDQAVNRHAS